MLLSTAYFPPVAWMALAARDFTLSPDRVLPSVVQLEACENYQKQSYRNRCYILASDGPQMLQVPVVHGPSPAIRDVMVDYSTPWVIRTQRALNLSTIRFLLEKTGIACALSPTTGFAAPDTLPDDYRYSIHPKLPGDAAPERPYYQVFRDRLGGFTPKLSCLDLLFNEGPDSILWLKSL